MPDSPKRSPWSEALSVLEIEMRWYNLSFMNKWLFGIKLLLHSPKDIKQRGRVGRREGGREKGREGRYFGPQVAVTLQKMVRDSLRKVMTLNWDLNTLKLPAICRSRDSEFQVEGKVNARLRGRQGHGAFEEQKEASMVQTWWPRAFCYSTIYSSPVLVFSCCATDYHKFSSLTQTRLLSYSFCGCGAHTS